MSGSTNECNTKIPTNIGKIILQRHHPPFIMMAPRCVGGTVSQNQDSQYPDCINLLLANRSHVLAHCDHGQQLYCLFSFFQV